jgi:LmbE family N-acetylglucosaminyl deacetylase
VDVAVDCAAAFDRKVDALRCHRTQGEMEGMPYELWPTVLGREEFQIAWPAGGGWDAPLPDVFAGLPDA